MVSAYLENCVFLVTSRVTCFSGIKFLFLPKEAGMTLSQRSFVLFKNKKIL